MMQGGAIIDATILNAPSSTKNVSKAHDPEMHQTKKGNEWRFGMKCHIGMDAGSGLIHTLTVTATNEHDITQTCALLREEEKRCTAMPVTSVSRNVRRLQTTSTIPRLTSESTAIPGGCLMFPTMQLTENGILKTKNHRFVAKWSMYFKSLNASLDIEKQHIAN